MDGSTVTVLLILSIVAFVWMLPILVILLSGRTTCGEKLAWILAVLFISWFAFIF